MKHLHIILIIACAALLASSCSKTYMKINYLQDVEIDQATALSLDEGIVVQPKDEVSIIVNCPNPELAAMFNLAQVQQQLLISSGTAASSQNRVMGYIVDNEGNIDFPILGKLHIAGLTRWGLEEYIKGLLVDNDYIKDPVVTVSFLNFKFSVLGEVKTPGTYSVESDKVTIFTALSMAGDLTIYGQRDNVIVIREDSGERIIYELDLRSTSVFESPAYLLRQNDVIYVTPSKVRAGQSTINENNWKSVSLWTSMVSLLVTVLTFAVLYIR